MADPGGNLKNVILFDLGNTLVRYYERSEFPGILQEAMTEIQDLLRQEGLLHVSPEAMWHRVKEEDHEASDHHVRPLEGRLARIFQLDAPVRSGPLILEMCRRFLRPIFARARIYEDTLPTLQKLSAMGLQTAIISNTPWGSPAVLWQEELERLRLREHVDTVVFCTDVGWRKPARQIFECTLEKLPARPHDCLFVGDDPRWDLVGPRAVGIEAVLIDRRGGLHTTEEHVIRNLYELWELFDIFGMVQNPGR